MINKAYLMMAISIVAYSFYPVFIVGEAAAIHPLLFVGLSHSTALLIVLLAIIGGQGVGQFYRDIIRLIDRKFTLYGFWGGLINALSHGAFFLSFLYWEPLIATLLYELWPIIGMMCLQYIVKGHYNPLRKKDFIVGILAFLGFVILVFSGDYSLSSLSFQHHDFYIGLFYALAAMVFMAWSSAIGVDLNRKVEQKLIIAPVRASFYVQIVTKIISGLAVLFLFYLWPGQSVQTDQLLTPILVGLVVITLGSSCFLAALSLSKNANLTIAYYMTPILSVLWLVGLGYDDLSLQTALGAGLIIGANIFIVKKT